MTLGCLYTFCYYKQLFIITPRAVQSVLRTHTMVAAIWLQNIAFLPAISLGRLLQVILNFRSRRFAGAYKICSALGAVYYIFSIACTAPWIVGDAPERNGISTDELSSVIFAIVMVYQALRFPSVTRADEEEDTK